MGALRKCLVCSWLAPRFCISQVQNRAFVFFKIFSWLYGEDLFPPEAPSAGKSLSTSRQALCLRSLVRGILLGPLKVLETALKSFYLSLQSDDGKLVLMKAAVAQHVR